MKSSGYTLIELLMVLAVIAILVGLASLGAGTLLVQADERARAEEYERVQVAIHAYNTLDVQRGADAIPARLESARVQTQDEDAPFARHLLGSTRFAYTWDATGIALVQTDDEGLLSPTGTTLFIDARASEFVKRGFVTLTSTSDKPLDLDGWTVTCINGRGYTFDGYVLLPGDSVHVYAGKGIDTSTDLYVGRWNNLWKHKNDIITIRDANNSIIFQLPRGEYAN